MASSTSQSATSQEGLSQGSYYNLEAGRPSAQGWPAPPKEYGGSPGTPSRATTAYLDARRVEGVGRPETEREERLVEALERALQGEFYR
jgi:hypothetical protein